MNAIASLFDSVSSKILSEDTRKKIEVAVVIIAIGSFLIHLLLILFVE